MIHWRCIYNKHDLYRIVLLFGRFIYIQYTHNHRFTHTHWFFLLSESRTKTRLTKVWYKISAYIKLNIWSKTNYRVWWVVLSTLKLILYVDDSQKIISYISKLQSLYQTFFLPNQKKEETKKRRKMGVLDHVSEYFDCSHGSSKRHKSLQVKLIHSYIRM